MPAAILNIGRGKVLRPDMFGRGRGNDTAALLAFFNACIENERPGFIPGGTYAVDEGELLFDCNFTDTPFPVIRTAGHESVIFKGRGTADAPLLTLSNGTASSAAGRYWRGGYLGGITFLDETGDTAPNRHGIQIGGTWGVSLGWMRFQDLRADAVHVPDRVYSSDNPDPYASSFTKFRGLEAVRCKGAAIKNLNYVGMDGWEIEALHAVDGGGGWIGGGSGCSVGLLSAGGLKGWAYDDGVPSGSRSANRNTILVADLDNVENGIRLNRSSQCEFRQIRFVHRFQSGINTAAEYWPRTAVDLAGGSSSAVSQIKMEIAHRVEGGGSLAQLGTFVNGHNNGNVAEVAIDQNFSDQGSIGVTPAHLFSNMLNTKTHLTCQAKTIWDSRAKANSLAHGTSATVVPNTGLGSAVIAFPTESLDPGGNYNPTNSSFTAPYEGLFDFEAFIPLTLAAGTRVRMALIIGGGNAQCLSVQYAATNAVQTYVLRGQLSLDAGEVVQVTADQNTAASVSATPVLNNAEIRFACRGL